MKTKLPNLVLSCVLMGVFILRARAEDFPAEDRWTGYEDRGGVRAGPEKVSANPAGHARPLHAAKVTTSP